MGLVCGSVLEVCHPQKRLPGAIPGHRNSTGGKVGLQVKTIMPFFMGLGCTIAGATGTRVVDNWGQRVLAIAMSWAVPCAATLSVVPTIAIALFGSTGGFLVILSIFLFMFLMMWIVYKVLGARLSPKEERVGLIMELPPYHKPDFRNILYVTFQRTLDIFCRALRVISIVSIVFFVLTYGFGGSALAATARETHSVKWTAKIGVFYTVAALLISCVVYHIGLLVF